MGKIVLLGAMVLVLAGSSALYARDWDRWDRDRGDDVAGAIVGGVVGSVLENVLAPRREERVIIREERDDWRWREERRREREDSILREAERLRIERAEEARRHERWRW